MIQIKPGKPDLPEKFQDDGLDVHRTGVTDVLVCGDGHILRDLVQVVHEDGDGVERDDG